MRLCAIGAGAKGCVRSIGSLVRDARGRALASALVAKVNKASWDLTDVLSPSTDPFRLVESEMAQLNQGLLELVANKHPLLATMARYYFAVPGKRFRPTLVLLMGQACGAEDARPSRRHIELAEIVEMIHTASLAHDDVLDEAETRRGQAAMNARFGNKLSVLVGDFLLARASVALAGLRDHEVTGLLSAMIAELVEGEFVQLHPSVEDGNLAGLLVEYERKCYLKTASMLAASAQAAAVLSAASPATALSARLFGHHLGLAFQVIDDVLDLSPGAGKDHHADLRAGLATAPVLFAAEELPELRPLLVRRFAEAGDVERAAELVARSAGQPRARRLAAAHAARAREALAGIPPGHSRDVLDNLVDRVLDRKS